MRRCNKHFPKRLSKDGRCLDCRAEAKRRRTGSQQKKMRLKMAERTIDYIITNNGEDAAEVCMEYRELYPKAAAGA